MAVDESKTQIDDHENYVWTAVDCNALQEPDSEVTPGRSNQAL